MLWKYVLRTQHFKRPAGMTHRGKLAKFGGNPRRYEGMTRQRTGEYEPEVGGQLSTQQPPHNPSAPPAIRHTPPRIEPVRPCQIAWDTGMSCALCKRSSLNSPGRVMSILVMQLRQYHSEGFQTSTGGPSAAGPCVREVSGKSEEYKRKGKPGNMVESSSVCAESSGERELLSVSVDPKENETSVSRLGG